MTVDLGYDTELILELKACVGIELSQRRGTAGFVGAELIFGPLLAAELAAVCLVASLSCDVEVA